MSTPTSTQSQATSILSCLNTGVDIVADCVSRLTRFIPNTYHRLTTDAARSQRDKDAMPSVRYLKSYLSGQSKDNLCEELDELTSGSYDWHKADREQRRKKSELIDDISTSIEGTEAFDKAARSSLRAVLGWSLGYHTPIESEEARAEIAKADRWWTRPLVLSTAASLATHAALSRG